VSQPEVKEISPETVPLAAEAYAAGSIVQDAERVIIPAAADMEIAREYLHQLEEKSVIAVIESSLGLRPRGWNPDPRYAVMAGAIFHEERSGNTTDSLREPLKVIC
jgi:hypothetical protein